MLVGAERLVPPDKISLGNPNFFFRVGDSTADSSVAAQSATQAAAAPKESAALAADRERRMKWWHDARFGMFIHWGAYSVWGRHEWAMENEAIPVTEYAQFAKRFTPKPNAARDWALPAAYVESLGRWSVSGWRGARAVETGEPG